MQVRHLGRVPYAQGLELQAGLVAERQAGRIPDTLLLLEHDPVFTLGRNARAENVLLPEAALKAQGFEVFETGRGGDVTYHGPGQLVVYLLVDLRRARLGVRPMVREIEAAVIEWLDSVGISTFGKPAAPGVYTMMAGTEAKIAALGLRVARGCTYHGLAVNIAMDLAPFNDIDPCGYRGLAVTQLADLGVMTSVERAGDDLAPILAARLRRA